VQIPAGDTSLYHIHDHALLYVPISSSRVRTQVLGADWGGGVARDGAARSGRGGAASAGSSVRSESPLGTARGNLEPVERSRARVTSTTSYVEKPLTHRVGNVGDTLYRLIAIGNLSKGADVDSDNVSGLGTPELVNRYYRAFRVSLAPDDSTPPHRHAWPVVLVQQTAGRLTIDGSFQATTTTTLPGAFAYDLGSGVHLVKNSGRTTTEFVEVELRGGAPK
jgi:quercetin dioxygenase-like cupin family protein